MPTDELASLMNLLQVTNATLPTSQAHFVLLVWLVMRSEPNVKRWHVLPHDSHIFIITVFGWNAGAQPLRVREKKRREGFGLNWPRGELCHFLQILHKTNFIITPSRGRTSARFPVCFVLFAPPQGLTHCPSSAPLTAQFIWLSFVLNIFPLWDSLFASSFS